MGEYTVGFLEGNIHDFLLGVDRPAAGMSHVLITSLDSCREVARLLDTSEALAPLRSKATVVGDGLLIATRLLLAAERQRRIFFGFDEVWFVSRRNVRPKPADLTLVGPSRPGETEVGLHTAWLKESGCSLALGDGTGMNFVVKASGAARLLLGAMRESVHA